MATQVFISWSGELSQKLAEALRDWFPATLQFVKPYFTPVDIEKGTKWSSEISTELDKCNVGVVCLTRENLSSPWILFEAGALSKKIGQSRVCPVLFGPDPTDMTGPLTLFQYTRFTKDDFRKLVETINKAGGESKLPDPVLSTVFEKFWPDLEETVKKILAEQQPTDKGARRGVPEMVEEILELTRLHVRQHAPEGSFALSYADYVRQYKDWAPTQLRVVPAGQYGVIEFVNPQTETRRSSPGSSPEPDHPKLDLSDQED